MSFLRGIVILILFSLCGCVPQPGDGASRAVRGAEDRKGVEISLQSTVGGGPPPTPAIGCGPPVEGVATGGVGGRGGSHELGEQRKVVYQGTE